MSTVLRIEKEEDLENLPDNYILVFIKKKTFKDRPTETAALLTVDVDIGFFSHKVPILEISNDLLMYDISYASDVGTALLLFNVYDAINMAKDIKGMLDRHGEDPTKYDNRRIKIEM